MKEIEILVDKNKNGKEIDWQGKKIRNKLLSESYKRLSLKKTYRVAECGTYLEFKKASADGNLKLKNANFCKDRLCPMCSWRRSLKIFGQVSKIMDKVTENKNYRFLFLTLTVKNCEGDELSKEIDKLFKAFNLLFKRKQINKSILGWFRALEVTHNINKNSKSYNTYHPHFHIILMVNSSYFKKKELYINQKEWVKMWQECLGIDYAPQVNIKAFKSNSKARTSKSIAEVSKYTVKDVDYLLEDNEELTDESVYILNSALRNRRLVAFGKELRKVHKELNLDDVEEGNLINTDIDEELREDVEEIIEIYKWNVGLSQYIKFK